MSEMMLFLTIDHITQIENEGTNRFRKVAVEGCLHGELNSVYQHVEALEKKINQKFDLLIICGDFQSMRNQRDLEDMHCPEKYKEMGTFQEYFTGTRKAPVTTVFIGGNHEAVNSLRESHFGGWLAPNIYFLGQAGSIIVTKGKHRLRVTGCSGIYNNSDFKYCTRIERFPLRSKDRITAYHIKQVDIFRMELLARISIMKKESPENFGKEDGNFDIMLSHDWPKGIYALI
jgi:lariat debranching enzyme